MPVVLLEAHAHPLTGDEIYTVHIARAPTLRRMWAMAREIDLHPPLHYLLVRAGLHLPGPIWLTSRVPSMVAGAVATATLFLLTSRRLGSVLGVVSAAVLWTGPVSAFFWSDRPYMLWMALLTLLLAAYLWAAVEGGGRGWRRLVVFALSTLMISDQLIGIASLGAFALAEGVRAWRRRRVDAWMVLALFLPVGIGACFLYQVRHLAANGFPSSQIPTLGWAAAMYNAQVTQVFFLVSVAIIAGAYLWPGRRSPAVRRLGARPQRLNLVEGSLYLGLVCVPVVLMLVAAALRLQYWERYSACSVIGFAGLIPWMLYRRLPNLEVTGPLLLMLFLVTTLAQVASDAVRERGGPERIALASLDRSLPIVTANPMTFTEMSDREPQDLAERVVYLTDRGEAQRISGYTLFENEDKIARILGLPSRGERAREFVVTHPRFWLVANPADSTEWLLRSLVERGATVAWRGRIEPGFDDSDLYLVTVSDKR